LITQTLCPIQSNESFWRYCLFGIMPLGVR
jgi:hypothetical protein